jgi:hypothetical protein
VQAVVLPAVLAVAVATLSGCVSAEPPTNSTQVTAGGGTCKLPTLTVDPTTFGRGDKVTLTGVYFVKGCGGSEGTEPLSAISAVLTDAKGNNLAFDPIDSEGTDGRFELEVQIPADAAEGQGKIIVGQAGPVAVVVED